MIVNEMGPQTGMVDGQIVAMPGNLAISAGGQIPQPATAQGAGPQTLPATATGNGSATAAAPAANSKSVVLWSLAMFLVGYAILHTIHYAP